MKFENLVGTFFLNKRKIINDPVFGFIDLPDDLIFDLVEHPWFQRLRRIRQLGLTFYVYPAAGHTRFQHALGSAHLMNTALEVIQRKGYEISREDWLGALIAILLHDIGHGPFSHALENILVDGCSHEQMSLLYMQELNKMFDGELDNAISIFTGSHHHKFLHQLVASQLDMDRLDYLRRDSFFTGVTEGAVGSERIIKMLRVIDDELVVDRKGIYSIEKFLIARRLMYWQVYFHKTVLVAERMLVKTFERAKQLTKSGEKLFATPSLATFLQSKAVLYSEDMSSLKFIDVFSQLDDNDIFSALKVWQYNTDPVLSMLADGLLNRKLLRIEIQRKPFSGEKIDKLKKAVVRKLGWDMDLADYLVFEEGVSNNAYNEDDDQVRLWDKSGRLIKLSDASDIIDPAILSQADNKYFLCYPKWIDPDMQ